MCEYAIGAGLKDRMERVAFRMSRELSKQIERQQLECLHQEAIVNGWTISPSDLSEDIIVQGPGHCRIFRTFRNAVLYTERMIKEANKRTSP